MAGCTVNTELRLKASARPAGSDAGWSDPREVSGAVTVEEGQELRLTPAHERSFGNTELGQLVADFADTNLTALDLRCTGVMDPGLVPLAALRSLTTLNLGSTGVTDAGLVYLVRLTDLTHLDLSNDAHVTDAGIAHLAGLTNLTWLDLRNTGVTDTGIAHLAKLTNLRALLLEFTGVTDAGVAALKRKLPRCDITK